MKMIRIKGGNSLTATDPEKLDQIRLTTNPDLDL